MATTRTASDDLREIIMGAQDNLTNVLAVVLGVAIGSGETSTVALAGVSAGVAEAISMGGVLYNATKAERDLAIRTGGTFDKRPARAGLVTALAALAAAAVPLAPFALLPLTAAMLVAAVLSLSALFAVGVWTGGVTGEVWWRSGIRFLTVGGLAALAASVVGLVLER